VQTAAFCGALIALIIAAGTNLFSYWNADKLVLSMHGAQEVDERSAPELVAIVRELAQRTAILLAGLTGLFMAVGYLIGGGSGAYSSSKSLLAPRR
jgi:hypothetical protein